MTESKQCPTFFPQPSCSGNGACDNTTGLCVCSPGWTSIGDYSTISGLSCSINIAAIRVLWALEVIASIGLLLVTSKYFFTRYAINHSRNKNVPIYKDPLFLFPFNFWVESLTGIILGVAKVIDPERFSIALEPLSSVMFGWFYVTGVQGVCAYLYVLIRFVAGYARLMSPTTKEYIRKEGEVLKKCSIFVAVVIIPICAIPLIAISAPGHDRETVIANLVGFAFIASFLIGSCVRYLGIIVREIEKHLNESHQSQNTSQYKKYRDTLVGIKGKLNKIRTVMGILGPSSIVTFGTLAAWELLSRNTSYLWPLQLLATDVQFIPIMLSMMSSSDDTEQSNSKDGRATNQDSNSARVVALTPDLSTPGSPESSINIEGKGVRTYSERNKYFSDKVAPETFEESYA